jgi:hypothetical protein
VERIEGRLLEGEILDVDDTCFVDCNLQNCTLKYGGGPVIFERTRLSGCRYVFFGYAKASVEFLQAMGLLAVEESGWDEMAELPVAKSKVH